MKIGIISDTHGHAEVCCHFCNERYEFSKEELQAIYDKAMANRSHAEA